MVHGVTKESDTTQQLCNRVSHPLAAFRIFSFPLQDCNNRESWSGFLRFLSYLRLTQLLELVGLYLWTNFGSFQLLSLSTFLTPQSFSSDANDTNINFLNNPKGSWGSFSFYFGGSVFLCCLHWLVLFFPVFCFTYSLLCI